MSRALTKFNTEEIINYESAVFARAGTNVKSTVKGTKMKDTWDAVITGCG